MTTNQTENSCYVCKTCDGTFKCTKCGRVFCFEHLQQHRQEIADKLGQVKVKSEDLGKQIAHFSENMNNHPLMQAIDDWMKDSIMKVERVAKDAKATLRHILSTHAFQLEETQRMCHVDILAAELAGHADEVKAQRWSEQIDELKAKLDRPAPVGLFEDVTPLVLPICVTPSITPYPARWTPQGETVVHGLNYPRGLFVDGDQIAYIADGENHRIVAWKPGDKLGEVVAGSKDKGAELNQLNRPTDVIVDCRSDTLLICDRMNRRVIRWPRCPTLGGTASSSKGEIVIDGIDCWGLTMDDGGALYVSDWKNHEVRRYTTGVDQKGTVVAGGHGDGAGLDQLNFPTHVFVDAEKTLYVADTYNHRVMKWMKGAKKGIVVAGGHEQGADESQLSYPKGVWVNGCGHVYVADQDNHRVMRWQNGAKQGTVIVGGNGRGSNANQLSYPDSLLFDSQFRLYVVDCGNGRVQRFSLLGK